MTWDHFSTPHTRVCSIRYTNNNKDPSVEIHSNVRMFGSSSGGNVVVWWGVQPKHKRAYLCAHTCVGRKVTIFISRKYSYKRPNTLFRRAVRTLGCDIICGVSEWLMCVFGRANIRWGTVHSSGAYLVFIDNKIPSAKHVNKNCAHLLFPNRNISQISGNVGRSACKALCLCVNIYGVCLSSCSRTYDSTRKRFVHSLHL